MQSVPAVEWPTVGLWLAIHGLFAAATWWHAAVPPWLLPLIGAPLVCWHASYQHEAIHGHPTRVGWLNAALAGLPLMLWVPYGIYRDSHLKHHENEYLTDPIEDPESFYVTPGEWALYSTPRRVLHRVVNALAGRLLIGPAFVAGLFLCREALKVVRGRADLRAWAMHAAGAGLLLSWVLLVCEMSLWTYLLCFAYPGTSLLLLRSFAEHHAAPEPEDRTAIVEAEPPFALLFLNNNLHVAHHDKPGVPWYRLPRYEAVRRLNTARPSERIYRGYREIARHWLFRAKESPVHPHL
ncbi:fatty acid desaturase [Nisaea acidiphila]|uniref:Fatty acid desaturase n=1 Tax=Nisaea acidiphila TaxID=1862145 RepID=A0A9J7AZ86_9PROT|nr:fatty acid desaturase [Nisaea acidiphila]UUX50757.1 fatty acid desaturase [Nisaea acidiphila]